VDGDAMELTVGGGEKRGRLEKCMRTCPPFFPTQPMSPLQSYWLYDALTLHSCELSLVAVCTARIRLHTHTPQLIDKLFVLICRSQK
jgi:hypothetical protein